MKKYIKGERFGSLVALEETNERYNGAIVWRCLCDCGNEVFVESRKLSSGKVRSCGCSEIKYPRNIAGIKFGMLTAIEPTEERIHGGYVVWRCICDCGNEVMVSRNSLVQGMKRNCGCNRSMTDYREYIGRKFGLLTVIDIIRHSKGYILFRCRCDCGRELEVKKADVLLGRVENCGCVGFKPVNEIEAKKLEYPIQGRIPKNNKSGCKGVTYNSKKNKWVARLMYKGTNYYLGEYSDLTDAINARTRKYREVKYPAILDG